MWTRQRKKSKLCHLVIPVLGLCVSGYFSFHAINGSLGLHSSELYQQEITGLQEELEALKNERLGFDRRTTMLSDGSLDADMIDEHARASLGLTKSNEIILLHSSN